MPLSIHFAHLLVSLATRTLACQQIAMTIVNPNKTEITFSSLLACRAQYKPDAHLPVVYHFLTTSPAAGKLARSCREQFANNTRFASHCHSFPWGKCVIPSYLPRLRTVCVLSLFFGAQRVTKWFRETILENSETRCHVCIHAAKFILLKSVTMERIATCCHFFLGCVAHRWSPGFAIMRSQCILLGNIPNTLRYIHTANIDDSATIENVANMRRLSA